MQKISALLIVLFLCNCTETTPTKQEIKITGFAQGTTYHISYITFNGVSYERSIDSLLIEVDNSLSTYQKTSLISRFNRTDSVLKVDKMFTAVFKVSKKVYKKSDGAFNPAIAPIVNAWGFGFKDTEKTDSTTIDSLMQYINFDDFTLKNGVVSKKNKYMMLDFNAIAQGYSVDVLCDFLTSKGITNYMVEVGGELRTSGTNLQDTLWRIGIDKPLPNLKEREIEVIINLDNKALATSGNYRKIHEKDGKKYSHTINPKTGYPIAQNLLSATVITNKCVDADAYATTFMVVGLAKSKEILKKDKNLEGILIFSNKNNQLETFVTKGINDFIELNPKN